VLETSRNLQASKYALSAFAGANSVATAESQPESMSPHSCMIASGIAIAASVLRASLSVLMIPPIVEYG
jgi:hypothetical protein